MKITYSWLKDHLTTNAKIDEITSTLNNIGLEVESIGEENKNSSFLVAKIIKAEKHPNADKLKLCTVDLGSGKKSNVVCGASNARDGLLTVYAGPGAVIPKNQLKIKVTNIRGVDSYGMLCSASELSVANESDGIIELDKNKFKIGENYFKSNIEPAIDIAITPNRGDCLAVRGIARDLSAAGKGKLSPLKEVKLKHVLKNPFKIFIEKNSGCFAFSHCYIEGVKNVESPKWLKEKLLSIGLKPISAIVDATNYIMIDLNRPLHAYDSDKIKKNIIIRSSKKNEKFHALDQNTYLLNDEACLITNENEILGLGGVIGGDSSSVSMSTKNILLESALFDPIRISKIAKKLGINSEAKFRFERGVDFNDMVYGLKLSAEIIQKLCGGKVSNIVAEGQKSFIEKKIKFNLEKFKSIVGNSIASKEAKKILTNLGFKIKDNKDTFIITVPSWRGDIHEEVDIVEELIRIRGYDKIELINPTLVNHSQILNEKQKLVRFLQRSIANQGFMETVTYSFTNSKIDTLFVENNKNLNIINPISNDLNVLRSSIFSNLLIHLKNNINRNFEDQKIFECGPTFYGPKSGQQKSVIGAVQIGKIYKKSWLEKDKEVDIFDVKNYLLKTFIELGIQEKNLFIRQESEDYFHPGKSGKLYLNSKSGIILASFGEFNPKILKELDIKQMPIFGFEIYIDQIPLENCKIRINKSKYEVSNFQKVERDFAFIIDQKFEAEKIITTLLSINNKLIKNIRVFDVFQGGNISSDKKSIALNFVIQSLTKTLTEKEIEELSQKIVQTMKKTFDATLRS